MKGTPMYRNYGIGKAPLKDYDMEKGSHDHPHSPAKNMKDGEYKHDFESPAKQRITKQKNARTIKDEGGDTRNEKGQTQKDVIKSRQKNIDKAGKNLKKGTKNLSKAVSKGMSMESANEKRSEMISNLNNAIEKYNFSADSIKTTIPKIVDLRKAHRELDAEAEYERKTSKKDKKSSSSKMLESPAKQTRKMDRLKRKLDKVKGKYDDIKTLSESRELTKREAKKGNRMAKKGKKIAARYNKAGDKAVKKGKLTKSTGYDYDSDPERRYNN